jgi:hypothetical protein
MLADVKERLECLGEVQLTAIVYTSKAAAGHTAPPQSPHHMRMANTCNIIQTNRSAIVQKASHSNACISITYPSTVNSKALKSIPAIEKENRFPDIMGAVTTAPLCHVTNYQVHHSSDGKLVNGKVMKQAQSVVNGEESSGMNGGDGRLLKGLLWSVNAQLSRNQVKLERPWLVDTGDLVSKSGWSGGQFTVCVLCLAWSLFTLTESKPCRCPMGRRARRTSESAGGGGLCKYYFIVSTFSFLMCLRAVRRSGLEPCPHWEKCDSRRHIADGVQQPSATCFEATDCHQD